MKHSRIESATGEMRDEPRKHVLMQATIISVAGPQRAFVKDITATGAKIHCEHALAEDWDVIFRRGETFRAARVAWTENNEAGLQFYRELD